MPGSFALTLDAGTLAYGGPSASFPTSFGLSPSGGTVEIINAGAVLTINGAITGSSAGLLTKTGPGTLILGNSGNQFNGLTINNGVVAAANDNMLGFGPITINPFGTLRYSTTTSTSRMFTLFDGVLEAASGVTLTLNSAAVGGGFLAVRAPSP